MSILLDKECPSSMCLQSEQVEIARVVLHRAGSHDYERVKGVVFKRKQFSCFNNLAARRGAEKIIEDYQRTGIYPGQYNKYRLAVLQAAVAGPGMYSHYRRCEQGQWYSWSSTNWYTENKWHHCFSAPEYVGPYQDIDTEDQLIEAAASGNNLTTRG